MAARYWRVVGLATRSGGRLQLTGAAIWISGSRTTLVATCSLPPVQGAVASLAVEANTDIVEWDAMSVAAPGFALTWDTLSTPTNSIVLKIKAGANADGYPRNMVIQSSTDMLKWDTEKYYDNLVYNGAFSELSIEAGGSDPHSESVVLQLITKGSSGSNVFTDSSPSPKPITTVGNVTHSAAASQFGGVSAYFDGGTSCLQVPASTDFQFGGGDFTIEGWIRPSRISGAPPTVFFYGNGDNTSNATFIWITGAGIEGIIAAGATNYGVAQGIAVDVFSHFAFVRHNNSLRMYVNGVSSSSRDVTGVAVGIPSSNPVVKIGALYASTVLTYIGYIDEFRVTKGVTRYTSDFTPPTQSFETVASTGTATTLVGAAYAPSSVAGVGFVDGAMQAESVLHLGAIDNFSELSYAGPGTIKGTVFEKSTPSNLAAHRKVRLHEERTGLCVQETWSDQTTGAYQFNGVPLDTRFTVISYDHTGAFRAVVASGITSELTP